MTSSPVFVPVRAIAPAPRPSLLRRVLRAITLGAIAGVALSGCATVNTLSGDIKPFTPVTQGAAAYPQVNVPQPLANAQNPGSIYAAADAGNGGGSIYGSGGRNLRLFEDNKARDVGDLLTIMLVESTSSATTAKTSVTKDSGVGLSAPSVFGQSVTYKGKNILEAEVEGKRKFGGAGNSTQSNSLDGNLTVTVVQRMPNGNLLVRGNKQMRLNQGDELVQIQGVVRPADIGADNRITSDRVGEAQIVYGGKGTIARSNAMGWLGRFFNNALFPY